MKAKIRNQIARRKRRLRRRLDKNDTRGSERPVMTATNIVYEIGDRTRATNIGGIAAIHQLGAVPEQIDRNSGFWYTYALSVTLDGCCTWMYDNGTRCREQVSQVGVDDERETETPLGGL